MDARKREVQQRAADPPATLVAQARRYLEDLVLFEGGAFVASSSSTAAETQDAPPAPAAGDQLAAFCRQICECTRCPLGHTRQNFVFGAGNPEADLMFVGEGPGAEEDRQGLPFVGAAGQLLTKIIEAMQLAREQVYICNAVKCRPPGNREPSPEEMAACEPHLQQQIAIVQPKFICALGKTAAKALLKIEGPMRELRGRWHTYQGIPVIVTYHPAALLRHAGWKRDTWEDMKQLRKAYDGVEL